MKRDRFRKYVCGEAECQDCEATYTYRYAGKTEKKSELSKYDSIVQNKLATNKDKDQFARKQNKLQKRTEKASVSSDKKENDSSNENKLKPDDKNQIANLKSPGRSEEGSYKRSAKTHNESISLSTVLATSVAVKSRQKKSSTQVEYERSPKNQEGDNVNEQK